MSAIVQMVCFITIITHKINYKLLKANKVNEFFHQNSRGRRNLDRWSKATVCNFPTIYKRTNLHNEITSWVSNCKLAHG